MRALEEYFGPRALFTLTSTLKWRTPYLPSPLETILMLQIVSAAEFFPFGAI